MLKMPIRTQLPVQMVFRFLCFLNLRAHTTFLPHCLQRCKLWVLPPLPGENQLSSWSTRRATPASDPTNFWMIALSGCVGKTFHLLLNSRLTSYLIQNKLLDPTMHYAEVGDIQQGLGLPGKAILWAKNAFSSTGLKTLVISLHKVPRNKHAFGSEVRTKIWP